MNVSLKQIRKEMLGVGIVVASLLTAAVLIAYVLHANREMRLELVRGEGRRMMQVCLATNLDDVPLPEVLPRVLKHLPGIERSESFCYLAVRDGAGELADSMAAPESRIPAMEPVDTPSSWYAERLVKDEGGRWLLEYRAPVFNRGEFAGTIALGFFEPEYALAGYGSSFVGSMALPVVLLGAFSYLLFKRETKPLTVISRQLQAVLEEGNTVRRVGVRHTGPLEDLVVKLNALLERNWQRISELEGQYSSMLTTDKVMQYKFSRLEAMIEKAPVGIMVMDQASVVTFANHRVEALIGVDHDILLGKPVQEWCEDEDLSRFLLHFQGSRGVHHHAKNLEFQPARAPEREVEAGAYPLLSGEGTPNTYGTMVVFRDITSEAHANRARENFVVQVAHEIKSPLNTLKMYSEMLLGAEAKEEALRVEATNVIYDEVERLSGMINSMVSIAKIEMGALRLDRQRVKLTEFLQDVFETASRSAARADVEFILDLSHNLSHVFIDKGLLRVVLNNLIGNAVKYNRPGGSVTLHAEETEHALLISVKDTGIGVAPEETESIFDKFYRSDNPEVRKHPGHGLGLALVKEIVDLHHGDVRVASELGKGSEFVLVFNKSNGILQKGG